MYPRPWTSNVDSPETAYVLESHQQIWHEWMHKKTSKDTKRHRWLQRLWWVLLTHHLQAECLVVAPPTVEGVFQTYSMDVWKWKMDSTPTVPFYRVKWWKTVGFWGTLLCQTNPCCEASHIHGSKPSSHAHYGEIPYQEMCRRTTKLLGDSSGLVTLESSRMWVIRYRANPLQNLMCVCVITPFLGLAEQAKYSSMNQ